MRRATLLVLVSSTIALSCGGSDSELDGTSEPIARPVVVDTDLAADDALALLFLLQRDDIDIRAVVVSGTGEAHCDPGVANARGLLELVDQGDIPVACGPEATAGPGHDFPAEWRRDADRRYGGVLPAGREGDADPGDGVALLVDSVMASDEPVTVVTLGPLTNLALALERDGRAATNIERVVIMGGALDVDGNVTTHEGLTLAAEWNLYVDPAAARAVVASGLPITLVALDATDERPVDVYFFRALSASAHTPAAQAVYSLFSTRPELYSAAFFHFWDPLAAAVVVNGELVTTEAVSVDIVVDGDDAGRLVRGTGGVIDVAVAADLDAFERIYLATLDDNPSVGPVERTPDVQIAIEPDACSAAPNAIESGRVIVAVSGPPRTEVGAAIGILDPGRGAADIEALFAAGAIADPPQWFQETAVVDGDAPTIVDLEGGVEFTVVCVQNGPDGVMFAGLDGLEVSE